MAALWRWRALRKAAGKPIDKPNLVCGPVQICWHKFCRYWDIEMREIPMAPGKWKMDVDRMLEQIDENTIVVVPTFGVTYTGAYELPAEIAKALDDYENKTGISVDIHVDGASGGFLAPFCAPDLVFDFRIPASSPSVLPAINTDWLRSEWAGSFGEIFPNCLKG